MDVVASATSALALLMLIMQEWRVGVSGARSTLIKTLQETVEAQAKHIEFLEKRVARLEAKQREQA